MFYRTWIRGKLTWVSPERQFYITGDYQEAVQLTREPYTMAHRQPNFRQRLAHRAGLSSLQSGLSRLGALSSPFSSEATDKTYLQRLSLLPVECPIAPRITYVKEECRGCPTDRLSSNCHPHWDRGSIANTATSGGSSPRDAGTAGRREATHSRPERN